MPEPRDSYRRCLDAGRLANRHFDLFLDSDPRVRSCFAGVDAERNREALRSLHLALLAITRGDELALQYVLRVGRRRGSDVGCVPRELHDCWVSSLVDAVRECDPEFGPEVERAWREAGRSAVDLVAGRPESGPLER